MKLVNKFTLILICLSSLVIFENIGVSASFLRRKTETGNSLCPKVYVRGDQTASPIEEKGAVYPGDSQKSDKALENAKLQTSAARKFFSKSLNAGTTKSVISNVAKNFSNFIVKHPEVLQILVNKYKAVARQAQSGGTWSHFQDVFGEIPEFEGLTEDQKREEFYKNVIVEIENKNPVPKNVLGFLGLLGDVGACLQDVIGRGENNADKVKIKDAFISFFGDISSKSRTFYENYSPDKYYDIKDGAEKRGKQAERAMCSKDNQL